MKKLICLLLAVSVLLALGACGGVKTEQKPEKEPEPETKPAQTPEPVQETKTWIREGYYADEAGNMLTVTRMEETGNPGWYVGITIGDTVTGGKIPQEGTVLHGNLNAWDENAAPLIVTVSEEGEDGLSLAVENGETYHFKPMELPKATIFVHINTEGMGSIAYAEGVSAPEIDVEYPAQSAQINLAEPATYTFLAEPKAGNLFVKWTKNGEDFSTQPQITVLLGESADYIAVFQEDPDWQNPVMNFIGEYQCDRAHAKVECLGGEGARITIEWGGSAWERARWDIVGRLDTDTLTIKYSGCTKQNIVYDDNGDVKSQEVVYEDGTGTIIFHDDGTFTWHEDQSETGNDLVFKWSAATDQNA